MLSAGYMILSFRSAKWPLPVDAPSVPKDSCSTKVVTKKAAQGRPSLSGKNSARLVRAGCSQHVCVTCVNSSVRRSPGCFRTPATLRSQLADSLTLRLGPARAIQRCAQCSCHRLAAEQLVPFWARDGECDEGLGCINEGINRVRPSVVLHPRGLPVIVVRRTWIDAILGREVAAPDPNPTSQSSCSMPVGGGVEAIVNVCYQPLAA